MLNCHLYICSLLTEAEESQLTTCSPVYKTAFSVTCAALSPTDFWQASLLLFSNVHTRQALCILRLMIVHVNKKMEYCKIYKKLYNIKNQDVPKNMSKCHIKCDVFFNCGSESQFWTKMAVCTRSPALLDLSISLCSGSGAAEFSWFTAEHQSWFISSNFFWHQITN